MYVRFQWCSEWWLWFIAAGLMVLVQWNIWWVLSSPPYSHSSPATAWVQTTGTLFGTASKDSPSELPPSITLASSTARQSPMASRTSHVYTLYTDQVSSTYIPFKYQCKKKTQSTMNFIYFSFFIFFFLLTVSNIMDVYLNSSGPVQALKGERLVLNCTATGELNTRVNITWDYPGKVRPTLKSVEIWCEAEKDGFKWQMTFDRDWDPQTTLKSVCFADC